MDAFNASNRLWAQAFDTLMDGAFHFIFRSFQVVENHAVTVAKGSVVLLATNDQGRLAVLQSITAVIGSRSLISSARWMLAQSQMRSSF